MIPALPLADLGLCQEILSLWVERVGDGVGKLRRPEKGSLAGSRALAEKEGTGPGLLSLFLWP